MGSDISPPSRHSSDVLPAASGHWATMASRCPLVMVRIRSACPISESATHRVSCSDRSSDRWLIAWAASAEALPPEAAATPAEATMTPWSSTSSAEQPSLSANRFSNNTCPIGLRQVLPVQTSSTIRLADRRRAGSDKAPCRRIFTWLSTTLTTVEGSAYLLRPSLMTSSTWSPSAITTSSAQSASASPERFALVSTNGPSIDCIAERMYRWSGMRIPTVPAGETA